jgi:hypothetical protein
VVLVDGEPIVWVDPRSHHVVAFDGVHRDHTWAEALVSLVKDGRRRAIEVRKVDGEPPDPDGAVVQALQRAGFVLGYRGWVLRD